MFKLNCLISLFILCLSHAHADLGAMWGTEKEESKYYKLVNIPIPHGIPLRVGSMDALDEKRLAVGTRRGDVYILEGAYDEDPNPTYHLFATGQDEIFGLSHRGKDLILTEFSSVVQVSDRNNDGKADRYYTLSNNWGYAAYHEFAFGSKPDKDGNIWVALGLTASYRSHHLFRGWGLKITPDGKTIPVCSGLRSPGGVGANKEGVMFMTESQGPWNGSCSLKHMKEGAFLGHPASYNWYPYAKQYEAPKVEPKSNSRILVEKKRVKEFVPPTILFPYIKMGRSISGFQLNQTKGKFGPFEDQLFLGDYSLSIIIRATTEKVNGVWQGACYPFREGLSSGIMNVEFTPKGQLMAGGFRTNRQWPVRGTKPYALERLDWTGLTPFEIKEINIKKDGFLLSFTKPVDKASASKLSNYKIETYCHIFRGAYGSPEVDQTEVKVTGAAPSEDGMQVKLTLNKFMESHIHDFTVGVLSKDKGKLLHKKAYYTVNEIPKN